MIQTSDEAPVPKLTQKINSIMSNTQVITNTFMNSTHQVIININTITKIITIVVIMTAKRP